MTPAGECYDVASFDGETFDPAQDGRRLGEQLNAVFETMKDGRWRTIEAIVELLRANFHIDATDRSVSARLRDFRKERFGRHTVNRRGVPASRGLFEYQLLLRTSAP